MHSRKIVDRNSTEKLFVQIYSIIKQSIEQREWPLGSQILTEDELCAQYGVSKSTVRLAVAELARQGYVRKQQGKGTFVAYRASDLGIMMKTKLTENMVGDDAQVARELISLDLVTPTEDIKTVLKTNGENDEEELIHHIRCLRSVDGEPAYLEDSFVPLAALPDIEEHDVCRKPLYELIMEKGVKNILKVVQTIEVSRIGRDAALVLRAADGCPALLLHRLLISVDERPAAYTRLLGTGRKYKLQTELQRIR
jgi:GntR family transcriptional regulator